MIPKRKVPQTGQQLYSKQTPKSSSTPSTKSASKQTVKQASKSSTKTTVNPTSSSQKQDDQKMPSIVELLQNQIEEERKNVRNKNQAKARQNTSSSQSRQILQKKKSLHDSSQSTTSQKDIDASRPPPNPNKEKINENPKYVSTETSPHSTVSEQAEIQKTVKVQMTAEAVGDDEAPKPKKLEPTGFTYFDKLNEKDIFLDPLKYF